MNVFDKICAAPAFALGVTLILLGIPGLFIGCKAWFTLPPILGVLPVFVGWGILRCVYLSWKHVPPPRPLDPEPVTTPPPPDMLPPIDPMP